MYKVMQLADNKMIRILGILAISAAFVPSLVLGVVENGSCAAAACDNGLICNAQKICVKQDFGVGDTGTGLTGTLGNKPLIDTITQIINVALSLLGLVAVVIVLIGGFKWMTAGGNEEQVTEGRKWITSGIIGIAIILSAFAITRFVIGNLSQATGSGTVSPQ